MRTVLLATLFCLLGISLYAQPYLYYRTIPSQVDSNFAGSPYSRAGINRLDLSQNVVEVYFEEFGRINQVLSNSIQDILFVQKRDELDIFAADKAVQKEVNFFPSDWLNYQMDAPLLNRVYLVMGEPGFPNKITILDRTDFTVLDTIDVFRDYYMRGVPFDKFFFSSDQTKIYDHKDDSTGFYFTVYDSYTGTLETDALRCGTSGPFLYGPSLEYATDGIAVLRWKDESGYTSQYYKWCDIDQNQEGPVISFPWRSYAYLSPKNNEVIIERVDWIRGLPLGEAPELHTGDIYIFDYESGKLKNYLKLPEGGEILLYNNFPENLYYFIGGEDFQTYAIDLNTVISREAFTDTLETFRYRSCEELDWATNATVCGTLENQLSDIKTSLSVGDSVAAANTLQDFLELVEQENEVSLTSEGYGLLYFNGKYLADRLPEPQDGGGGSGITCGCDNPVTQSSGTIAIQNGETRCLNQSFSGSVFFQSGGILNVCSTASFQNVYGNQPGVIQVSETGDVTVGNWNNNSDQDGFTNWGTTTFTNWMTINKGTLTNHGTMSISGGLNQNDGSLINHGALSVNNSINLNKPGNQNSGELTVGGTLTLNGGAELSNSCQVDVTGQLMVNGFFRNMAGAYAKSGGQLTINSGGEVSLEGDNTMMEVNRVMLNGTITTSGNNNLLAVTNQLNSNSGATVSSQGDPLQVCATNVGNLPSAFDVVAGCQAVIAPSPCNPNGYGN